MTRTLLLLVWLVVFAKSDSFGQITWKRSYGGLGTDIANSIVALPDGGAIICGSTGSFGAQGGDMYVLRVDISGILVWSRLLGGSGVETGRAILALSDGTFLAIGSSTSFGNGDYDGYLVRLSNEGNVVWEHTYGSAEWDFLEAGSETAGGFYLTGQTFDGTADAQAWVLRVLDNGDEQWSISTGWSGDDQGIGVIDLGPEGCVVGGTKDLGQSGSNAFLIQVSSIGEEIWSTVIDQVDSQVGRGIALSQSGDLLITGYSEDPNGRRQMYLARTNAAGQLQWSNNISSSGNDWEANAVAELPDGRIIVGGYTKEYGAGGKDMSMLILNANGGFISGPTYGGASDEEILAVALADDGAYYLAGSTKTFGPGMEAVFIVRSDGDTLNGSVFTTSDDVGFATEHIMVETKLHPNPAISGSIVQIEGIMEVPYYVSITDMRGRGLFTSRNTSSSFKLPLLQTGPYLILVEDGRGIRHSKLIIE